MRTWYWGILAVALGVLGVGCSGKSESSSNDDTGESGGSGGATPTGGGSGRAGSGTGGSSSGSGGSSATGGSGGTSASGGASATGGTSATGGASGSGGSGGGDPDQRQALLDLYREVFRVQCEFDQRCAAENGRNHLNLQVCFDYVEYLMALIEVAFDEVNFYEFLVVTPGDYRACAETIYPTNTCDTPTSDVLSPECEAILTYDDPLEIGDLCRTGAESTGLCGPGTNCSTEGGCGHCEISADVPDGMACELSLECMSERCLDGICVTPQPRGSTCTADDECRGYLRCSGTAGAMTCSDALGEGAPCTYDDNCVNGLSCRGDPAVCSPDVADGTACDRTGTVQCSYQCVFATPDAPTGQCGFALPAAGEACAYTGESATCGDGYASRTVSTDGVDTGCVCVPREQGGGPCRAITDCLSYSCVGYDSLNPSVPGTCDPVRPIDGDCYTDTNCESGFCNDGLCATPPVCG